MPPNGFGSKPPAPSHLTGEDEGEDAGEDAGEGAGGFEGTIRGCERK
jgi:hypothetical protein